MKFNALLLAAGEGKRLMPLTANWPKCLMPIHGRPLLDYWLSDLFKVCPQKLFVNTHYLAEIVERYLSRECFKNQVILMREKELLGTAGTILSIKNEAKDLPTLVIHADNWCGMEMKALLHQHLENRPNHCLITMMTFETDSPQTCGVVEVNDLNVVYAFYEKQSNPPGNLANAAVYVIEPEVFDFIESTAATDFSEDVLPHFIGKIFAVQNDSFHRDIGSIKNIKKAMNDPVKQVIWDDEDQWFKEFRNNPIHAAIDTS